MASDATEQLLLRFGIDLSAAKTAGTDIKAILDKLNTLSDEVAAKAKIATQAQKVVGQELKNQALEAVAAAKLAVLEDQKKLAAAKQNIEAARQNVIEEQRKAAAARVTNEQARLQLVEEQKLQAVKRTAIMEEQRKTAEIRTQNALLAQQARHTASTGGDTSLLGRIAHSVSGGLFGGGLAGSVAGGVLMGGGIGMVITAAVQGLEHFVEKLKEVTKESGKLTIVEDTFKRLAAGAGIDAAEAMDKMREKTEGLVSTLSLLKLGSTALRSNIGISVDQMTQLAGSLVKLGEASGRSTPERSIQRLEMAMSRGRPEMLAFVVGLGRMDLRLQNVKSSLSEVEKSQARWQYAIEVLNRKSEAVGELPETLEKAMTRIHLAWEGLLKRFGQGFNLSGGMQALFDMLRQATSHMGSMNEMAKSFGENVGNAFSVMFLMGKSAIPVIKELFGSLAGIANILVDLTRTVTGRTTIDSLAEGSKEAVKAFEAMHPLWSETVRSVIMLSSELKIMFGLIHDAIDDIDEFVKKAAHPGAAVADAAKNAPSNLIGQMAEPTLSVLGGVRRFWSLDTVLKAASKSRTAFSPANLMGTVLPSAIPFLGGRPGETSELEHANIAKQRTDPAAIRAAAERTYASYAESALKSGKAGEAITKDEQAEAENKKEALKRIQEKLQMDEARIKQEKASQKLDIQIKQDGLAEQKQLEDEAYKNGDKSLEAHIAEQIRLGREGEELKNSEILNAYLEAQELLRAKIRAEIAKGKVTGDDKGTAARIAIMREGDLSYKEFQRSITQERNKANRDERASEQQLTDATRSERMKALQDELVSTREFWAAREKIIEKAHQNEAIGYEEYYAFRVRFLEKERDATIKAAEEEYELNKKDPRALLTRDDKLALARQAYGEKVGALTPVSEGLVTESRQAYQQRSGALELGFRGALDKRTQEENLQQQYENDRTRQEEVRKQMQDPVVQANKKMMRELDQEYVTLGQKMHELGIQLDTLAHKTLLAVITGLGQLADKLHGIFTGHTAAEIFGAAGSAASQYADINKAGGLRSQIQGWGGQDKSGKLNTALGAVSAVADFAQSISQSKSTLGGMAGGAMSGASAGSMFGPIGAAVGAAVGTALGGIVGHKNAQVEKDITNATNSYNRTMQDFAKNSNDLAITISSLQSLVAQVRAEQAASKKGSSKYQSLIDSYNQQIQSLSNQQLELLKQMNQQVAILEAGTTNPVVSSGLSSTLTTLQSIVMQYQKYVGAISDGADATQQLATANQFLTQSLQNQALVMENQILNDNTTAIQDALSLNDLLFQRTQLINQINTQIEGVLSQGVLTRQSTRAQTAGQKIQDIQINAATQLAQLNEQIQLTQFKVAGESKIFDLATTRIGLESQLLLLQERQANQQIQVMAATKSLYDSMVSGGMTGPLAALLASIPGVGTDSSLTDALEKLFSAAYADRSSLAYGNFSGTNL